MNLHRLNTQSHRLHRVSSVEPQEAPSARECSAVAYRVPWRVVAREPSRSVTICNDSAERLTFVRFAVAGEGHLGLSLPRHVHPGESLSAELQWPFGAADTMITVRWFRPDGHEYLWALST